MIELYTWPTPNGWKVSIALEEMGVAYVVRGVDIMAGEQKQSDFLRINPNGRVPAIIDTEEGITVFESGAILIYLAEISGRLLPVERSGRTAVIQWLMFQMSGIGPMMGQANIFSRYFPEKIPAAIDRFQSEVRRLFSVLDGHFANNEYLAGDYSIADIANWSWVQIYFWAGVSVDDFPNLRRWLEVIEHRPAVQAGVSVIDRSNYEMLTGEVGDTEQLAKDAFELVQTGENR